LIGVDRPLYMKSTCGNNGS